MAHFHIPKPLHGWREFAGEVGIIVLGVLIALGAEQILRDVDAHRAATHARYRIKDELGTAIENGIERMSLDRCLRSRLSELAKGLASGRKDWSQLVLPPSPVFKTTFGELYHVPSRNWVNDAYREALAQGDLNSVSPTERASLANIYKQIDQLGQLNEREHELNTQLATLQFNPTLSQAERNQMLGTVAQLDWINALMLLISHQVIATDHRLGASYELKPEEIEEARRGWAEDCDTFKRTTVRASILKPLRSSILAWRSAVDRSQVQMRCMRPSTQRGRQPPRNPAYR